MLNEDSSSKQQEVAQRTLRTRAKRLKVVSESEDDGDEDQVWF